MAEPEETEVWIAREEGCLCPCFLGCRGSAAAAATVGSPVGKISAALWNGAEPAITINERKRPVSVHKGGRKSQSQTKNNGMDEGRKRGKEGRERERALEEVRDGQREGLQCN